MSKFYSGFSALQLEVIGKLAAIENEDEKTCSTCSGEDCACCEIYHDRMKWEAPGEFMDRIATAERDLFGGGYDMETCEGCGTVLDEWCEKCGLCPDCCNCEMEV